MAWYSFYVERSALWLVNSVVMSGLGQAIWAEVVVSG
jgi:hypothetical protein